MLLAYRVTFECVAIVITPCKFRNLRAGHWSAIDLRILPTYAK